ASALRESLCCRAAARCDAESSGSREGPVALLAKWSLMRVACARTLRLGIPINAPYATTTRRGATIGFTVRSRRRSPLPHQHPSRPVTRPVLRPPQLVLRRPHLFLRLEQRLPLGLLLDPHAPVEVDHQLACGLIRYLPKRRQAGSRAGGVDGLLK